MAEKNTKKAEVKTPSKKTRNIILIVLLLLVVGIAYAYWKVNKTGKEINLGLFKIKPSAAPRENLNVEKELKPGSSGEEVKYFQAWLNKYYDTNLVLDGDFGQKTIDAIPVSLVQPYQIQNLKPLK